MTFTNIVRRTALPLVVFVLLAASYLAFTGCTKHEIIRSPKTRVEVSIPDLVNNDALQAEVESHCVEINDDFSLAFVEFDDQGELWSRDQVTALEQVLRDESSREDTDGLIILIFIHGWKHNAGVCDENVVCMREVLKSITNAENVLSEMDYQKGGVGMPRRVVGVYLGWRGLSITTPIIKNSSFWARKAAAHRVGSGDVIEVISRIEAHRNQLNARVDYTNVSRMITVGHSFGAAVTFTAVAKIMHERLISATIDPSNASLIHGFGDLVVLVNPAFEASLYAGIHNLASGNDHYLEAQKPVFAVVSSETDSATKVAFPAGRWFSTLFERTRSPEQKRALRTTLGNNEPYRTHSAAVTSEGDRSARGMFNDIEEAGPEEARGADDCICSYVTVPILTRSEIALAADSDLGQIFRMGTDNSQFADVTLTPTGSGGSALNPFYVIGASDEIVTQHNGIYNQVFIDFLRAIILAGSE